MPRKFTPDEERRIDTALRRAGRTIMGARGVRKTSIDELTRAAGISKGSFYRFYTGKEALALDLLAEWEREFHGGIEQRFLVAAPRGYGQTVAVLESVLLEDFPRRMVETGMQGLFEPDEISYLTRSAGEEEIRVMDEQDIRLFERLKPLFLNAGLTPSMEEEVVIAGLRVVFEAGAGILRTAGPAGPAAPEHAPAVLRPHHFRRAFTCLLEGFLRRTFHSSEDRGGR